INDSNFGYVSLSNYAPVGKATRAGDAEPLPVTGINTLVGTIRQNAIVGRLLGNQAVNSLVDLDRSSLDATVAQLNLTLNDAATHRNLDHCRDIDGQIVDPVSDVTNYLKTRLPDNIELESVALSNGWLSKGSSTATATPRPQSLAMVTADEIQGDNYTAFVNI